MALKGKQLAIIFLLIIKYKWKQPNHPLADKWISKLVMCIYNGILFSPKKERDPTTCDNMDGP